MSRIPLIAALAAALNLIALEASAATNGILTGSDTLAALTRELIVACGLSSPQFVYAGGGSRVGEQAMVNKDSPGTQAHEQEIAPMSRMLQPSRACLSAHPEEAECRVIGLDAVTIPGHVSDNTAPGCDGLGYEATNCFTVTDKNRTGSIECAGTTCPGIPATYCAAAGTAGINPAFDFARLIWFGLDHNGVKNCNSDVRRSLVDNWSNAFENACSNSGSCGVATGTLPAPVPNYPPAGVGQPGPINTTMPNLPVSYAQRGGLTRVLRLGDASGTTETFASLLAGLSIPPHIAAQAALNPYCNGSDRQDGDPIRRRCDAQDAVCGPNVHSGLLQAITVDDNHTSAVTFPTESCTPGAFPLLAARRIQRTNFTVQFDCPERENFSIGGFCYTPVKRPSTNGNAVGDADCWNPPQPPAPTFTDGRVANRYVRATDGVGGLVDNRIIVDAGTTQGGFRNEVVNAYYRVRQNEIVPGAPGTPSHLGIPACQYNNSTHNVGCLLGWMRCSLGNAGLPAFAVGGVGLTIGNIPLSEPAIQLLGTVAEGAPAPVGTYPLARRLFLCSMDASVSNGDEWWLQQCFSDPSLMLTDDGGMGLLQQAWLIEPPAVGAVTCADFNETSCSALAPMPCYESSDCGVFACASDGEGGPALCDFSCPGATQTAANAVCSAKQPAATCLGWAAGVPGRCGFATNNVNNCL